MKKEHITFSCGKLKLEGIFCVTESKLLTPAVIVCHPHPLFGGSMYNNVLYAIAEALSARSISVLLFNFRGVGESEGSYGGGREEQSDVKAALEWLQKRPDVDKIKLGLAGYSFGAGVVFPVACADERVKAVAMVSPYFEEDPGDLLQNCTKPKLIVSGSEDQMVPVDTVLSYGDKASDVKLVEIVKGPDHFWGGYEGRMSQLVADFFDSILIKNQGI
jgi:uncharacterized protein